jgi:DNA-binding response OmpR family regulator
LRVARLGKAHLGDPIALAATSTVLVVAPDPAFRRSLEFALEAEGYAVASHAQLSVLSAAPVAADIACAIIDEDALRDAAEGWRLLRRTPMPVILLMDRLSSAPELTGTVIVVKPLLGNALITSVEAVIANRSSKPNHAAGAGSR